MKTFVIAEAGVNHNGSIDLALKLVDAAVMANADAVKFQTFSAEKLVTNAAPKATYQLAVDEDEFQLSMLKKLELSRDETLQISNYCRQCNIEFMSTAFDPYSLDYLLKIGIKKIKIPSGEITNHQFLSFLASKSLPLILSTGMSTLDEVQDAVTLIQNCADKKIQDILTILHCTSSYPTALSDVNLKSMVTMAEHFKLPVGYSDHTSGVFVSPLAVSMGASIIEKHITLDNSLPGPDHTTSLNPLNFKLLVDNIRSVEVIVGSGVKQPCNSELETIRVSRRSITLSRDISKGEILSIEDLVLLRPGHGIMPKHINNIVGRKVNTSLSAGTTLTWDYII